LYTHWNIPVMIACPRSGQVYNIATTRDAFRILTTAWPVAEGTLFIAALAVCERVAEGTATPEDARRSFIAAADEAKIVYELIAPAAPR
jgi:hypothetical protein